MTADPPTPDTRREWIVDFDDKIPGSHPRASKLARWVTVTHGDDDYVIEIYLERDTRPFWRMSTQDAYDLGSTLINAVQALNDDPDNTEGDPAA